MNITFLEPEIYNVKDVPDKFFDEVRKRPFVKRKKGNNGGKTKKDYVDLISAFDIETTRIHDYKREELQSAIKEGHPLTDNTVMYIWQWCFTWNISTDLENPVYKEYVIYGRRWFEYKQFIRKLTAFLNEDQLIVVFDHNLAYEFQFLRGIQYFAEADVFNVKARQPLKAVSGNLEYRCSYKLSNMSLRKFAESMNTPHQKTELAYEKKRYWYTPLTDEELTYAVNDVICLCECIVKKNLMEGDTLYTMPLTSTGYVRREVKAAVVSDKHLSKRIRDMMPSYAVYKSLKRAFRGGNTHANRFFSQHLLRGIIHSADRSSSYPAVICNAKYPMREFQKVEDESPEYVMHLIRDYDVALLTTVTLSDVKLHDSTWGCPYISSSKCNVIERGVYDNGRVLSAAKLECTVTDIDLAIILDEYDVAGISFKDSYTSTYGRIPQPIIDKVIEYYQKKTSLKGVEGYEYFYMKNKNLLNSIYGMMVQDLVKVLILYCDGGKEGVTGHFEDDLSKTDQEILEKAEKKGFLNYAWGVWVTAWARYELEQGIKLVHNTPGAYFIYCDTDSVKYIGEVDWSEYNSRKVAESNVSGSHATDPKGNEHYMGVFEAEHDMDEFITLGAKKYAYHEAGKSKDEGYVITVAGVGKKDGVNDLIRVAKEKGIDDPLELFKVGFIFSEYYDEQGNYHNPGGLEAVYNDMGLCDTIEEENSEGAPELIISNVTLRPSTYTLSITDEYSALLGQCEYEAYDDLVE